MDQTGECWLGQRATLIIELLAPGFFSGAPTFDLPDPPGLLLMPPAASPTLSTEQIAGTTFTVQRYELFIIPRRAGNQTIPPITIRFHFKRNPLDKEPTPASLTTTPVKFTVKIPPGAESLGSIISAKNFTATENWTPLPGKSKPGDAYTRTITQSAPNLPAIAFPPFSITPIDGIGTYPKTPEITDETNHCNSTARRTDTITYICQRPDQFVIPAAQLSWFDVDAKQIKVIRFPSRTFDVLANPLIAGSKPQSPISDVAERLVLVLATTLACVIGVVTCAILIRRHWQRLNAPFRPVHLAQLNPRE